MKKTNLQLIPWSLSVLERPVGEAKDDDGEKKQRRCKVELMFDGRDGELTEIPGGPGGPRGPAEPPIP